RRAYRIVCLPFIYNLSSGKPNTVATAYRNGCHKSSVKNYFLRSRFIQLAIFSGGDFAVALNIDRKSYDFPLAAVCRMSSVWSFELISIVSLNLGLNLFPEILGAFNRLFVSCISKLSFFFTGRHSAEMQRHRQA
ncbi:MAG: hypothetical protein RSD35_02590, partial [Oscillospiraceae bacterium]